MKRASVAELRLRLKRAFSQYYLELCSSGIADPTETFETCSAYFNARRRQMGDEPFDQQYDAEVYSLAGEIEQDLRQHHRAIGDSLAGEPLETRLRECAEAGWRRAG